MDNLYSSFYLYKKYEIIGDELIDLGITSIDADGTQEAVMKEECDPACGCPEPIYRWVQTEDTVCVGEEPAVQYRWTACGTTCDNANKYQNNIKEQSLDEGLTWTVVIPEEYSASTLVQQDSYDCGYRTGTTSSSTYCNGDDLYVDVYYRTSRDSGTTWTTASTTPTLVEAGGCATPASPKFTLTLNDSSTVSAECDSTSAITSGEVSSQYSGTVVSAVINDCVSTISASTFYRCTSLTSCTIPDSVTSIDRSAFYNCSGLTSVNIPTGVTSIGQSAFRNCYNLSNVTIPNGITAISNSAFDSCRNFTTVTIPSGVTSIESYAFYMCTGLTSITCLATTPPTLTGRSWFYGVDDCPIYVPCESVSAYQAATNWSDYASRIEGIPPCGQPTPSSPKFTLTLSDSSIVSAECDSTSSVTSGEVSSQYSGSVISAVIGDCVTSIGDSAFGDCTSLTSVTIPDSVTTIGYRSFKSCYNLTNIDIPDSVTRIYSEAFETCRSLTSCTIGSGVERIARYTFYRCTSLSSLIIPDNVKAIEGFAFYKCSDLTTVTIGSGVTYIGEDIFLDCSGLTSVTVLPTTPPTLYGVGQFDNTNNCPIYVPCESLSAYQSAWSAYASRIQCNEPVFEGKFELTLSDSSTVSAECDSTSAITKNEISAYSASVTSVVIGNCVTNIDHQAFRSCSGLTSIDIPSGVTTIGQEAFRYCSSLTSMTVNATTPPLLYLGAVSDTNNCPIYVPAESVEAYKTAGGWSREASRIQAIP